MGSPAEVQRHADVVAAYLGSIRMRHERTRIILQLKNIERLLRADHGTSAASARSAARQIVRCLGCNGTARQRC